MSGLILCDTEAVKHPLAVRELGIHLYSKEELAYYIYNYVFLLENDFLGENLLRFISDEIGMPKLAAKIKKWSGDSPDHSQVLYMILQDLHYYSEAELVSFRNDLEWIKKAAPSERIKRKADYMLGQKKYTAAITLYDSILSGEQDSAMSKSFMGLLYHNRAMAHAGLFEYEKSMNGLIRAYECLKTEALLKEMYFLCLLSERRDIPDALVRAVTYDNLMQWKAEYDDLYKHLEGYGNAKAIGELWEKDSVRKKNGVEGMMNAWKQQYREMAKI